MSKVKVRRKDILRVIVEADQTVRWSTASWKARARLLRQALEESGQSEVGQRDLYDYCAIPACGCPGDRSHP